MKNPDYIIIGSTRCGTTSMYNYISAHPDAKMAKGKGFREVHFFDYAENWKRGADWYRAQFSGKVAGETSPTYLQHPLVPGRVEGICPDVKFIVMLRDPVDRAWSDYWLARRKGWIDISLDVSFEEYVEKEREILNLEWAFPDFWTRRFCMSHTHLCGFLERGRYAEQLGRWLKVFDRHQFYVVKSEDFFDSPPRIMARVLPFLGLDTSTFKVKYRIWHKGNYPPMKKTTRRRLERYFRPLNAELYELLGRNFGWPRS